MSPDAARPAVRRDAVSETTVASTVGTDKTLGKCIRRYAPNAAKTPPCLSDLEETARSTVATASGADPGQLRRDVTRTIPAHGIRRIL